METFDDYMHIKDFLDWLESIKDYFDCMGVDDNMKVCFVIYKLKGGVRAQLKQLQHKKFLEGQDPITYWP